MEEAVGEAPPHNTTRCAKHKTFANLPRGTWRLNAMKNLKELQAAVRLYHMCEDARFTRTDAKGQVFVIVSVIGLENASSC